jgi:hypothetical protein
VRFLFPLFLAGAAALLVPLVLHLARRQTRREIPFGSLMFLGPTRPRFDRRQRLEHWLLLALRCLTVLLLAAAFARPFFTRPLPALAALAGSRTVVLLDVSASMQRGSLWTEAVGKVRAALGAASAGDRVAVLSYDGRPHTVLPFEDWAAQPPDARVAAALARLEKLRPGWGSTDLGRALMAAAEAIVDDEGEGGAGTARVVVVSDLQQGSRLDALAASDWPARIELEWAAVAAPARSNAGMQALPDAEGAGKVRIRVTNAEGTAERFRLRPEKGDPIDVAVAPGQSRVVEAQAHTLVLEGDEQEFDNRLFLAPPVATPVRILYAGSDDGQDAQQPLFYLRRAFPVTASRAPEIVAAGPADIRSIDAATQLVVVTGPLPPPALAALRAHLGRGRAALLVAQGPSLGPTLAALLGGDGGLVEAQNRAGSEGYALLTTIDLGQPVLAPFADQRFGDFTKIRFWRHRRLDERRLPGARVLARFDDGAPAWLSVAAGAGTVFLMTSGWHPADSQLALSSKFVPLLHQILEVSAGLDSGQAQFLVGDPVMLPEAKGARRVRLPDGSTVPLPEEATTFSRTEQPGLYLLESGAGARPFAVNIDPAESATAPLGPEALERLGLAPGHPHPDGRPPAGEAVRQEAFAAGLEQQQGLWRWLLVAALLAILAESWLAPRTARRPA